MNEIEYYQQTFDNARARLNAAVERRKKTTEADEWFDNEEVYKAQEQVKEARLALFKAEKSRELSI